MLSKVFLVLENGKIFEGSGFGAAGETMGELVFTTAMTGYLETLTDPSYYGQIVMQTFPLIGNYGVIPADFESSSSHVKGYIVREWCQVPSNFRSEGDIDTFLKNQGIVGLYNIDTRALTRIVREYGVMNAKITHNIDNIDSIVKELKAYRIINAVKNVSCDRPSDFPSKDKHLFKVVLWDFGAKGNIIRELNKRGCDIITVPAEYTSDQIIALNPDGIMLSNGPGDPAENIEIITELSKLCHAKKPIFGICLGHQLLALANGAKTEKLKYGHRGANQPVTHTASGNVYITSQNHGYAVISDTLKNGARVSHENANDHTCEGIEYSDMPAFSLQFHPEASGGPLDTSFMFDKFIDLMKKEASVCR